jgi:formiminotetrahydrofolate cyclodeaminase
MVCNLTLGKKKYADVQAEMAAVLQENEKLRKELTLLIDKDTEAFNTVMAAFGLPKGTEQEQTARTAAIQSATKSATMIPLQVMTVCQQALRHTLIVAQKGNKNSASDAGVAALMLHAGCSGAALNVRINLNGLTDTEYVQKTTQHYREVLRDVEALAQQVSSAVEMSIGVN